MAPGSRCFSILIGVTIAAVRVMMMMMMMMMMTTMMTMIYACHFEVCFGVILRYDHGDDNQFPDAHKPNHDHGHHDDHGNKQTTLVNSEIRPTTTWLHLFFPTLNSTIGAISRTTGIP